METSISKPWFKALSGLAINLSAGWFTAIVIMPNFSPLITLGDFAVLTYDILFGILFLLFTVKLEEVLEK